MYRKRNIPHIPHRSVPFGRLIFLHLVPVPVIVCHMHGLTVATLLLLALLTGNEFCVAAFVEPVLRSSSERHQVTTAPAFAQRLGKWMPGWYAATLLLTAFVTAVQVRSTHSWITGAALSLLIQLAVLVVTLTLLVPRNNRLAAMVEPYPAWQDDARQWDSLHRLRVMLLFVATVLFAAF